jgi:hypothetical protein
MSFLTIRHSMIAGYATKRLFPIALPSGRKDPLSSTALAS